MYLNTEGSVIDMPKARSLAAIRRAQITALHAGNDPKGRDGLAMRAVQFALAAHGIETKYREHQYSADKYCEFARAADGSTRVRFVHLSTAPDGDVFPWPIRRDGGARYEIPHWDFVPSAIPEAQGAFA